MTPHSGNDDGGLTPAEFDRNGGIVLVLVAGLIAFLAALLYFA